MKGLLLKDLYMTVKYCRIYLLIAVVFIAVSFAGNDSIFFIAYSSHSLGTRVTQGLSNR